MFSLIKAVIIHPTSTLIGRILSFLFLGSIAIVSRLPPQIQNWHFSQLDLILTAALLGFLSQVYVVLAEHFAKRHLPRRALETLCKTIYRACCGAKSFDTSIRVTVFRPKRTLKGIRLVSVSRYSHGTVKTESSIKFKEGEGTVGMAYASNVVVTQENLPDPAIDLNAYFEGICARCNIDYVKLKNMHVHSRSFLSVPVKYADDDSMAAAVVSIDSTKPDLIPKSRRTRVIQLADTASIIFQKRLS